MPLDQVIVIDPDSAEGDVVLEGSAVSGWRARVLLEWEREKATGVRWRAHWGFCPDAELYRTRSDSKPT